MMKKYGMWVAIGFGIAGIVALLIWVCSANRTPPTLVSPLPVLVQAVIQKEITGSTTIYWTGVGSTSGYATITCTSILAGDPITPSWDFMESVIVPYTTTVWITIPETGELTSTEILTTSFTTYTYNTYCPPYRLFLDLELRDGNTVLRSHTLPTGYKPSMITGTGTFGAEQRWWWDIIYCKHVQEWSRLRWSAAGMPDIYGYTISGTVALPKDSRNFSLDRTIMRHRCDVYVPLVTK